MINNKAFENSGIPIIVLDVTKFAKINQQYKSGDAVKNNELLNFEFISNIISLINIHYINAEAKKIIGIDYQNNSLIDIYYCSVVVKHIINNIFDVLENGYKIIECVNDLQVNVQLFNIICSLVAQKKCMYVYCNIVEVKNNNYDKCQCSSFVEKYYLLVESINDAMILVNVDSGSVIEYNKIAKSLLKIDSKANLFHYQFFSGKSVDEYLKFYNDVHVGLVDGEKEFEIFIDGKLIPVKINISFSIIDNVNVSQVIFSELNDGYLLEKRRKLLAAAVDQVDDSVIITNDNGMIEYFNLSSKFSDLDLIDKPYGSMMDFFKNDIENSFHHNLMLDEISNGRVWRGKFTNKSKNGDIKYEDVTVSPVKNDNGTITNYIIIKRDITKKLLLENQIRQSQKIHAIGMLAGGIAHDFNNILTSILGFAELCKIQCDERSILYSNIDEIIKSSLRAGKLVDQILKFSRNKNKEILKFKIVSILKEVVNLIKISVQPGIQIDLKIVEDPEVTGDPTQIHQIFMNLCTNACQSIVSDQGIVTISLSRIWLSPQEAIAIGRLSPGMYVCIQVKDDGIGIPKEYMHRIFDPYFTTKKLNEGAGLGLSVVHGIVNDHRGAITVDSEVGEGSCFCVYLPDAGGEDKT